MIGDGMSEEKTILIVEDEPFIAFDIRDMVESLGYTVLGPASSCERAMSLLLNASPTAALLDENLAGTSVQQVAEELARRKIPFAIVSGHLRSLSPAAIIRDARRVPKPTSLTEIEVALTFLTGKDRRGHA